MFHLRLPQLLLGLAAVAIIATAITYSVDRLGSESRVNTNTNVVVYCAADVMLCPDGVTSVGRVPPSCEFAMCPELMDGNVNLDRNTNTTANVNAVTNTNTVTNVNATTNTNASPVNTNTTTSSDVGGGLVDNDKQHPIKKVTNLQSIMNGFGEVGATDVNVMGTKALIGGGSKLFFYDGTDATDISDKIRPKADTTNSEMLVSDIANNGTYWLISTTVIGAKDNLYSFDGTTWTDLTSQLRSVVQKTALGGIRMSWNGSYWLIADNPGHLVTYTGTTFTSDVFSQIPNLEGSQTIVDIQWNGSYFLFTMLGNGNHGKLYRYDGQTFAQITSLDANNYVTTIGWNGTYWLLAGFNNQRLLKFDGQTITEFDASTRQQATVAWLKPLWIIGPSYFDGQTLDPATPFNVLYRANDVSIGSTYGLLAGDNGAIYRFDFQE